MTAIEIACFTHAQRIEDAAAMSSPTTNDPKVVKEGIDAAADELI